MPIHLDSDFHDGAVDGFWLTGGTFHLLLSTEEGLEYALLVHEVVAVSSAGFTKQNIIFDLHIKETDDLTKEDMREVHAISETTAAESRLSSLLEKARAQGSILVVVDPSSGANCLVLGQSMELLKRVEWAKRFVQKIGTGSLPSENDLSQLR